MVLRTTALTGVFVALSALAWPVASYAQLPLPMCSGEDCQVAGPPGPAGPALLLESSAPAQELSVDALLCSTLGLGCVEDRAFGAGIFSDGALLVLIPGDPISPISAPQLAIFRPAAADSIVSVIALDCTQIAPAGTQDDQTPNFFASGFDGRGTEFFLRVSHPTDPIFPTDPIIPTDPIFPGDPITPSLLLSMTAGITTARPTGLARCGAADVPTSPVLGGYFLHPVDPI